VQTFLPVADFAETARILDTPRLGKQRVEVYQIVRVLDGVTKGWRNHPAVRMWRGYEPMLLHYGLMICAEWIGRGHADTVRDKLTPHLREGELAAPPWLGDEDFHASHRSNLLRKDPQWYCRFGWSEPDDLPYVWPV
jgi:hypothetical protein